MFTQTTADEIRKVAAEFELEAAALLAVAEIESGGVVFAMVDGRQEPLIRFEAHYFDRRLSGDAQAIARTARLASPHAGAVANPVSQEARWRLLARAVAIDRKAAYESVSWGLGQVMGAHWAWLDFADVDALVAEARSGTAGQARLMARFIHKAGLRQALQNRDWDAFARGYNGPAFRKNAYHTKLAAAFRRHAANEGSPTVEPPSGGGTPAAMLRNGSTGEAVRDLQQTLSAIGYPLAADGVFGNATEAAVQAFQRDHGLSVDGIAGPRTLDAVAKALPFGHSVWKRLAGWVSGWLNR